MTDAPSASPLAVRAAYSGVTENNPPDPMIARISAGLADRYRVERELGRGGMATVYLAEDLKHRRHVALKVLKPELAAVIGAERFLSEITTTANLQHPHILPLHDSGQVDGTVFYVMPYVEGESLRDRISREKQLPIADAVQIAREIAAALDYAHRQGVVHRDIKPENILLHDGRAVVADFGIALAASQTEGGSRLTETGMSLGTPHYMSPEQAMGARELDGRADIYALGCVLHEMLAGEPPFTGPTAQAIVAKVMGSEPERLTTLRRTVPPAVEDATLTALEKIPADRFATAAAFAAALDGDGASTVRRAAGGRAATQATKATRRRGARTTAVVVVLFVIAIWGWLRPGAAAPGLPPTQLALLLPDRADEFGGIQRQIEIAPDGSSLLYRARAGGELRTQRIGLDGSAPRVVDGVMPAHADYRVSPDGREFTTVNYLTRAVFRNSAVGGTPRPLPRGVTWENAVAWASDGSLWFSSRSRGLTRVSAADSVSQPFGASLTGVIVNQVLPGDRMGLATAQPSGSSTGPAILVDLRTGERRPLLDLAVVEIRYAVGFLVYVLGDGNVHAAPFDLRQMAVTGPSTQIGSGVTLSGTGIAQFSVAENGTVAFLVEAGRSLELGNRDGTSRVLFDEMRNYHHPRFSPDGRRLAMDFTTEDGRDVWIATLASGTLTRATFDRDGHDPSWTPDGRGFAYTSFREGVFGLHLMRLGTAQGAESLATSATITYTGVWLPDGSGLVTTTNASSSGPGSDIGILRNGGRGPFEPLISTRFDEAYPAPSPDGTLLAYGSNFSGRDEVYLRQLAGGGEIQVSVGGGSEPAWRRDGKELFYRAPAASGTGPGAFIASATIATSPTLAVTSRAELFSAQGIVPATPHANYDVSPDGKSFVYVRSNPSSRVMIIQNLPAFVHLRQGVSGAGR